jgi:uncharacterized integral membrane protein
MLKRYIIILVFSILVVIFAVQNVDKVAVKLWMFNLDASLSLIIIVTLAVGALLTLLFTYREIRSRDKTIRDLKEKTHSTDPKKTKTGTVDQDPAGTVI